MELSLINEPNFLKSLNQDELNIINKANELILNWQKKKEPCVYTSDEIKERLLKAIDEIDSGTAILYTKEEIEANVKNRLNL
ncbi:MAG: hypothetical protein GX282_07035 [Campylobacteraceae bacterium]|nr:hypothetical protein [Campylobacteraceae bacterium]